MNKEYSLNLLKRLTEAKGVSGFEDDVVNIIKSECKDLGELSEDSMRNVYLKYKNNLDGKPVFQLDAHSDEVGFVVQAIKPNGTLKILNLGSWVVHNIPAHKVYVRNKYGKYITGIVASTPPHFMSEAERNSPLSINALSVDVGARSKEEAEKDFGIRIGEPIVPAVDFEYDEIHDIMIAKAFDNRLGCAAIIDTIKELENENIDVNIIGTFSSQEEVGTRGAKLSAKEAGADIAIVFEGCPADDTSLEGYMVQTALKKGPMLRHVDITMITNPRWQRYALDLAEKLNIPVQEAVRSGGGTNGSQIHISNKGVPAIVIGVPVRYAHTHYSMSSYEDYSNAVKLAVELIKRINSDLIASF